MNIAWMFEWWAGMIEIENLYNEYYRVMDDSFFDPDDPDPAKAVLWLARHELLNVCIDIVRDLMWQNLENRYPTWRE